MVRFKRLFILLVLCVAGALLNIAVERFFFRRLALPLYMDTPFTVALTLYGGLLPGIVTGVLTNLIMYSLSSYSWVNYLFILCQVATALVTALFMRFFPAELSLAPLLPPKSFSLSPQGSERFKAVMNTIMALSMLSFALCLVLSISGGLIGAFINIVFPQVEYSAGPELLFKPGLLRKHLYMVAIEIISRIPLNIIDRIIAAFGGYGMAFLLAWGFRPRRKLQAVEG